MDDIHLKGKHTRIHFTEGCSGLSLNWYSHKNVHKAGNGKKTLFMGSPDVTGLFFYSAFRNQIHTCIYLFHVSHLPTPFARKMERREDVVSIITTPLCISIIYSWHWEMFIFPPYIMFLKFFLFSVLAIIRELISSSFVFFFFIVHLIHASFFYNTITFLFFFFSFTLVSHI